jgi:arginine deiminase
MLVSNEISTLKAVVVHRPDEGIEWVTPQKAIEYLYDDIVYLKKMQEEHDIFTDILRLFLGEKGVIDIQKLLEDILENNQVKEELLQAVCGFENAHNWIEALAKLTNSELALALLSGIYPITKQQIFPPIANYIFCRDIAVVINEHILISEANKNARRRESILTRFIIKNARIFKSYHKIELSSANVFLQQKDFNRLSIEGGDVMMIAPNHLLIGFSERTNMASIEMLKKYLFTHSVVESVTIVNMPKDRFCMHIDTIFTMIDHETGVGYEHLVDAASMQTIQYFKQGNSLQHASMLAYLKSIFPNFKLIACGGGIEPYASREQWTDACNLFTLKPSLAVAYDRNERTLKELEKNNYTIIGAKELQNKISLQKIDITALEKTIITIPSNELSRARGGTHCLTFPITRG